MIYFYSYKETEIYVKHDDNVNHWSETLLKRWRESLSIALAIVIKKQYIMNDVRRRRESNEYTQIIIRAARLTNISSYNKNFLIYNDLNLEFRRDLILSIEDTDMNIFLTQLKNKKKIW